MIKLISKLLPILFLAILASSCALTEEEPAENVLAKINDLEVTKAHFESAFKRYYFQSGQVLEPSFSNKSSVLDSEFNVYVLATYARQLGFEDSGQGQRKLEMIKRRVLNEEYLDQHILDSISVTEEDTRNMFLRFNTQLKASHLYAPTKDKADSLYNFLQQGQTFEELAKEVFQNKRLAESGGNLGVFSVDEMDVAFEQTAYSLRIGEISEPVRTAQGFSIIKLTDRFPKPVLSEYEYAVNKDQLAYFAEKQKRELLTRKHMYDFLDNLKLNQDNLEALWNRVTSNYSAFLSHDTEIFSSADLGNETVLSTYQGEKFTVQDFLKEYRYTPETNISNVRGYQSFENFIKGLAYRTHLMNGALEAGLLEKENVQASIDQTFYVYLAQKAEDEIRSNLDITEEEIAEQYYKDPGKYMKPVAVDLSRIVVGSEEEARAVVKKLKAGASFVNMVQKHSINNEERLLDGRLGFEYVNTYGFMSPALSKLQPGDLSEPIQYQTGEYHIYLCHDRREAEPMSLNEARETVKYEITKKKFQEQRSEIIEQVKKQHNAVVNRQMLKELTIQI